MSKISKTAEKRRLYIEALKRYEKQLLSKTKREKPYLPLTCQESCRDVGVLEREPGHRCCMAVVTSCREMLG